MTRHCHQAAEPVEKSAHKKSRPGQGRLRMGLLKGSSGCGRKEPFTSGGRMGKVQRPAPRISLRHATRTGEVHQLTYQSPNNFSHHPDFLINIRRMQCLWTI